MKYQRHDLVNSDSDKTDQSGVDDVVGTLGKGSLEPSQVAGIAEFNKVLSTFKEKELDSFDKFLLKGFYVDGKKENQAKSRGTRYGDLRVGGMSPGLAKILDHYEEIYKSGNNQIKRAGTNSDFGKESYIRLTSELQRARSINPEEVPKGKVNKVGSETII